MQKGRLTDSAAEKPVLIGYRETGTGAHKLFLAFIRGSEGGTSMAGGLPARLEKDPESGAKRFVPENTLLDPNEISQIRKRISNRLQILAQNKLLKQSRAIMIPILTSAREALLQKYGITVSDPSMLSNPEKANSVMMKLQDKIIEGHRKRLMKADEARGWSYQELSFTVFATDHLFGKRFGDALLEHMDSAYRARGSRSGHMDFAYEDFAPPQEVADVVKLCIEGMRGTVTRAMAKEAIEKGGSPGYADPLNAEEVPGLFERALGVAGIDLRANEFASRKIDPVALFTSDLFYARFDQAAKSDVLKGMDGETFAGVLKLALQTHTEILGSGLFLSHYQAHMRALQQLAIAQKISDMGNRTII